MLILANATDRILVALGGAPVAQLPVVASFRDITASQYVAGRNALNTNGVTAVQAVPAPASDAQRVVDFINIRNPNVANVTVIVSLDLNGTAYVLRQVILAQGETLEYQEGSGWSVYTTAGAMKNSLNQGTNAVASGDSVVVLSADIVNNNATANQIADITGLAFPVVAGSRFYFEFIIRWSSAATTTGARFSINGPTFNELTYQSRYSLTTGSETNNQGLGAYDLPAAANASSAATGGNLASITGIILPNADGNVIARFASEIAASAITARAGSFVRYRQL
jgi:hypothetical protein